MSLVTGLLNKTCTIMRYQAPNQLVSDGQGGWIAPSTSPTTIATGVLCTINRKSANQMKHAGGREETGEYTFYCEYRPEGQFQPNDIITDVALVSDPTQFDLDTVQTPTSNPTIHRQYRLVETPYDPNGERDHLEASLTHLKGRTKPI